ncbi:hypothetical protein [Paracoccus mutanolyticus]|nr:hypothetical protein [Paracoccus mutanolyticus]
MSPAAPRILILGFGVLIRPESSSRLRWCRRLASDLGVLHLLDLL